LKLANFLRGTFWDRPAPFRSNREFMSDFVCIFAQRTYANNVFCNGQVVMWIKLIPGGPN